MYRPYVDEKMGVVKYACTREEVEACMAEDGLAEKGYALDWSRDVARRTTTIMGGPGKGVIVLENREVPLVKLVK